MKGNVAVLGAFVTGQGEGYAVELGVALARPNGFASPVLNFTGGNIFGLPIALQRSANGVRARFSDYFDFPGGAALSCQLTRLDHYEIMNPDGPSLTGALALAVARLCVLTGIKPRIDVRAKHLSALPAFRSERIGVCAEFVAGSDEAKLKAIGEVEKKLTALAKLSRAQMRVCIIANTQECAGMFKDKNLAGTYWFKVEGSSRLRVVKCTDLWNMIDTLHQIQSWSSIVDR